MIIHKNKRCHLLNSNNIRTKMGVGIVKILLLIVLTLGLVLILGYHKLTFGFLVFDGRNSETDEVAVEFNFKRLSRGGFTPHPPDPPQEKTPSLFDENTEKPFYNRCKL